MITLLALLWALNITAMQPQRTPSPKRIEELKAEERLNSDDSDNMFPELRMYGCTNLRMCKADHSKTPICDIPLEPVTESYLVICGDEDEGDIVEPSTNSRRLPPEVAEDIRRWLCGYEDLS